MRTAIALSSLVLVAGCMGAISDAGGGPAGDRGEPSARAVGEDGASATDQAPSTALRRLSRREFENTLRDLFGRSGLADAYLPPDALTPYDNDAESKDPSAVFIQGLESLAFDVARDVSAAPEEVDALAGCEPSGAADEPCLRSLAADLGRRTWRRTLTDAELEPLVSTALSFATERDDFYVGARFVIQSLLQSPDFAYRVEIGVAEGPLRRLDNYEIITRLSYLIWATTPDTELLDRAEGEPLSSDEVVELADEMLADPRADAQLEAFHEQWLGYRNLRVPAELEAPMLAETEALVQRVLVDEGLPWTELFHSTSTFVDSELAAHYGMADEPGAEGGWAEYTHPRRAGVLSHGSLLSLSARNVDDTSPTLRGKLIATRLLCRDIPDPPSDVNADEPPTRSGDQCKSEAYAAHRDRSSACFTCHQMMDPIGFGLEQFDALGRFREEEKDNPECPISGEGELAGVGTFSGPRELAELMDESGELTRCGVQQFLQFATGRPQSDADAALGERIHARFVDSGEDFRTVVRSLVADPVFLYRVEAP